MASVQPGHSHGDLHDDESLLDDDLIEADDGEYFQGDRNNHDTIVPGFSNLWGALQLSMPTTPCTIPPTRPLYEATLNQMITLEVDGAPDMATT